MTGAEGVGAGVAVRQLLPEDRQAWEPLWAEYLDFYAATVDPGVTELTWARLVAADVQQFVGLGAFDGGRLVGVAHVVVGPNTWSPRPDGYLEDLVVAPDVRGRGIGHALVEAIADMGRERGWRRVHWITDGDNARAMRLYDDVAIRTEYVRYHLDL